MLGDLALVTRDQLEALALDVPDQLIAAVIPLWQTSRKSKYHWADKRSACKHLPGEREWRPMKERKPPPVSKRVAALEFNISLHDMCSGCAQQATLTPAADAFVTVVAELARARKWVQDGLDAATAGDWSWLQFARWKARQPLIGEDWTETVQHIRGKGWTATALDVLEAIQRHRLAAASAMSCLVDSIGDNPGRSAILERAIRMVETDSAALQESETILQISGCPKPPDAYEQLIGVRHRPGYKQPSPWHLTAGTWRDATKQGGSINVDRLADYFDEEFPHVHDLGALPCCTVHNPAPVQGDCVHTWALRSAQAHRRLQVAEWVQRLELAASALSSAERDATDTCTHLMCVPWWPLIGEGMDSIAYLAQFEVLSGPHQREGHDRYGMYHSGSVAVLKVPAWAAAHVAELPSPMLTEPITGDHQQAIRLARQAGVAIVNDEFASRRKPTAMVRDARTALAQPESRPGYYSYARDYRPLSPGCMPPDLYRNSDDGKWTAYAVRHALEPGAVFVYGADDLALLSMGVPEDSRWGLRARIEVELQTECPSHDDGPHLCDVEGVVTAVRSNGALTFTPEGLRSSVTIPAAYIVGLTVIR